MDWRQIYARIELKQPGFFHSACEPLTKHRKRT